MYDYVVVEESSKTLKKILAFFFIFLTLSTYFYSSLIFLDFNIFENGHRHCVDNTQGLVYHPGFIAKH